MVYRKQLFLSTLILTHKDGKCNESGRFSQPNFRSSRAPSPSLFSSQFRDSWWEFSFTLWFYFWTRPLKMSQRETKLGHFERWWLMFQPHHSNPAWRVGARMHTHIHTHERARTATRTANISRSISSIANADAFILTDTNMCFNNSVSSDICGDICAG